MKLKDNEFILLRDFIAQHFGIYFEDERKWTLESKLTRLLEKYSFKSFFEYYNYLVQKFFINQSFNDSDFIELIGSISNNETYFCREEGAFKVLRKYVFPEIQQAKQNVKILCAGCSTGAEAYSIAITLAESGILFNRFIPPIIGIDLDSYVLETAKKGEYNLTSFRGIDDGILEKFTDKYFSPLPGVNGGVSKNYLVKDTIKRLVTFQQVNILDKRNIFSLGNFDIVFCRNVLIYFSEDKRKEAIDNFGQLLYPGGYLFLGHSESIIGKSDVFAPMEKEMLVFYKKIGI